MNALRAMYGLRRVVLAVPSMILSASTIHLLNLPAEPAASHLNQGLHDLQAIAINHHFAARCVDIIRSLAMQWNIALPEGAASGSVFRGNHPPSISSPPLSAFFAASIPRKDSSDAGSKSSSTGSHHSPFQPPPTSDHRQHFTQCYSDPTLPQDPSQSQTTFWTPFPAQGMPVNQSPNFNTTLFEYSSLSGPQHWHLSDELGRHHSAPGGLNEGMGDGLSTGGEWSWQ